MGSTLNNANAFLAKHLSVNFVRLLSLATEHVPLERLCVHHVHDAKALLPITLPLWLPDELPLTLLCHVPIVVVCFVTGDISSLRVEPLEDFVVPSHVVSTLDSSQLKHALGLQLPLRIAWCDVVRLDGIVSRRKLASSDRWGGATYLNESIFGLV